MQVARTRRSGSGRWRAAMLLALLAPLGRAEGALDAGDCGACHATVAAHGAATGGHAAVLDCASCHAERRPGRVGPRHRAIARCADCHDDVAGHPDRPRLRRARRAQRNCLACHDPHGSTNRDLVRTELLWRRTVLRVTFTSDAGAAPGSFADPERPGTGLCEVCHRDTEVYRRDGTGEPHFADRCTRCHLHEAHFDAVVTEESCGLCHAGEAERHALPSAHAALPCGTCHAEVSPVPGPDHRAIARCESCHDRATHAPAGHGPLPCAQCHEPHGSENTNLVRTLLTTTAGTTVPIRFDALTGRADGSFASASAPGTGVCEVCHTTTQYYRADGGGAPHFTLSCLPCHRHADGFAP